MPPQPGSQHLATVVLGQAKFRVSSLHDPKHFTDTSGFGAGAAGFGAGAAGFGAGAAGFGTSGFTLGGAVVFTGEGGQKIGGLGG